MGYLPRGDAEYRGGAFLPGSHRSRRPSTRTATCASSTPTALTEVANVSVASQYGARRSTCRDARTEGPSSSCPAHPDPAGRTRERSRCPSCDPRRARSASSTQSPTSCATRRFEWSPRRTRSPSVPTARSFAVASEGGHVEVRELANRGRSSARSMLGSEATVTGQVDVASTLAHPRPVRHPPPVAFSTPNRLVDHDAGRTVARRRCPHAGRRSADGPRTATSSSRAVLRHEGRKVRDHVGRCSARCAGTSRRTARRGPSRCSNTAAASPCWRPRDSCSAERTSAARCARPQHRRACGRSGTTSSTIASRISSSATTAACWPRSAAGARRPPCGGSTARGAITRVARIGTDGGARL